MSTVKPVARADRVIKATACLCLILVTVAIWQIRNSPTGGYETSIYSATPHLALFFVFFSAFCGISVVVHQLYLGRISTNRIWLLGLFLVLFSYGVIMSLNIVRNYAFWGRGDALFHLRTIWDIISNGHVHPDLYYPASHIFVAQSSQISTIDPVLLLKYIPFLFSFLYVAFVFLLATTILPDKGHAIMATLASTVPLHTWYITFGPGQISVLMMPLTFFLSFKLLLAQANQMKFTALLILVVIFYPTLHPLAGLLLLAFMVTISIPIKMYQTLRRNPFKDGLISPKWHFDLIALLGVWWFFWVGNFGIFNTFTLNVKKVFAEHTSTPLDSLKYDMSNAVGWGYNIYDAFLKNYGVAALYLITVPLSWLFLRRKLDGKTNIAGLFSLFGPFLVFSITMVALYLSQAMFGPTRIIPFLTIIGTVFTGFISYEIIIKIRNLPRKYLLSVLAVFAVIAILFGSFLTGLMGVYESPWKFALSQQLTDSEIKGMNYVFSHKVVSVSLVFYYTTSPSTFAYLSVDRQQMEKRVDISSIDVSSLPFHFGYDKRNLLGESYDVGVYMLINQRHRTLYTEVFPEMAPYRFLPEDFEKLELDTSVDKIYSNGGLDFFYIHGKKPSPGVPLAQGE